MSNNKDFVVAEVQGNLGNWIFGYMFAHVWAKRNGISNVYVKPETPLYYKQIKYYDKLKDTVFRNLNLILNVPQGIQLYTPQMWYTEEDFSWIEQKDNIMFGGVVQCYNIYKDYRQDFIEIFGLTQEIKDEIFLNGLKYSVSEHFSPFIYPDEIFNKDTNKFIPFELWVQGVTIDKYNRRYFSDKIQDNLSNKEIIELYEPYLRHKYNLMVKVKKEFLNESCES